MVRQGRCRRAAVIVAAAMLAPTGVVCAADSAELPTGQRVTPTAAPGSSTVALNPGLPGYPGFTADGAVSLALSPDRATMLVLTSGYDTNGSDYYKPDPAVSNQYVFVYDVAVAAPARRQVIQIRNTYSGIAFAPDGAHFYVSGGVDDDVHVYEHTAGAWREAAGSPIALGHHGLANGVLEISGAPANVKNSALTPYVQTPLAAGLAVTRDGRRLVVANHYNDSITVVDLLRHAAAAELDLRPGKNGGTSGTPGGEYPYLVQIVGNDRAYVSSVRDREIVVVDLASARPRIRQRIAVPGAPNKMILAEPRADAVVRRLRPAGCRCGDRHPPRESADKLHDRGSARCARAAELSRRLAGRTGAVSGRADLVRDGPRDQCARGDRRRGARARRSGRCQQRDRPWVDSDRVESAGRRGERQRGHSLRHQCAQSRRAKSG